MIRRLLRNNLTDNQKKRIHAIIKRISYWKESVKGGGLYREKLLLRLLQIHYQSKIRRQWSLSPAPPHFFEQRVGVFDFAFTESTRGATAYSRGFYSAEMIRDGDKLLDIGCGDGFFSRRFFQEKCSAIDAIDIESSAIETAKRFNHSPKINYQEMDITAGELPARDYDVVVWDGAIGHFSAESMKSMLTKIKKSMKSDGVFTGSESIGFAGYDHLQQFYSLEDFHKLFKNYFRYVQLKSVSYRAGIFHISDDRTEGFWRCSDSSDRLNESGWKQF